MVCVNSWASSFLEEVLEAYSPEPNTIFFPKVNARALIDFANCAERASLCIRTPEKSTPNLGSKKL